MPHRFFIWMVAFTVTMGTLSVPAHAEEPTPTSDPAVTTPVTADPTPEASPSPEPSPTPDASPGLTPEVEPTPTPTPEPIPAPEIATITPTTTTLEVTWVWPDAGSSPAGVSEVSISVEPGPVVVSFPAQPNSGTVSGLAPGTQYWVQIASISGDSRGEPSEPVIVETLEDQRILPQAQPGDVSRLIVQTRPSADPERATASAAQDIPFANVAVQSVQAIGNQSAVLELTTAVDANAAETIMKDLRNDPQVLSVELDRRLQRVSFPATPPNDPYWTDSNLWGLYGTYGIGIASGPSSMNSVWTSGQGSGAIVAVLDTGSTAHPDLDSNYVAGYDFVSNSSAYTSGCSARSGATSFDGDYINTGSYGALGWDSNPLDPGDWENCASSSWHGTHVAGTIAAVGNNSAGVIGVAPQSKIQPVRVLSYAGGWISDIAAGITWASGGSVSGVPANATPADVINLSLGGFGSCSVALQTAINGAVGRGSVVVVSAGNSNDDASKFSPANCNNVITVASTSASGTRSSFSNFGSTVEIAAPGSGIWSTLNAGIETPGAPTYRAYSGTSMAAPHVSGVAALVKASDPNKTPGQILTLLQSTVQAFPVTGSSLDCTTSTCGSGLLTAGSVIDTAPSIASVAPSSGTDAGGDSVIISGYNFTGATAVSFGGTAAQSFTVDSDTAITAVTPAGTAGAVDVTVTQGGQTATAVGAFTYVAAGGGGGGCGPVNATSLSASQGSTLGGETVIVYGSGLCSATGVTFGGASATITANTDTSITVTTPSGSAGSVNVTVTTPTGTDTLTGVYTFVSPPATPVVGSVISGDHVLYIDLSTGTTADTLSYQVFDQAVGGTPVSSMTFANVTASRTDMYFFDYSGSGMTSGQTYYLGLEACNVATACTTSNRFSFSYTTAADASAATGSIEAVRPFDTGIQVAGSVGSGDFESVMTAFFTSSSAWAPYTWTWSSVRPSQTTALNIAGSQFSNGSTYYVASIVRTASGFSSWTARQAVTPLAAPPPPYGFVYFSAPTISGASYSLPVNWFEPHTVSFPIEPWSGTVSGYQVEYSTDGVNWSTGIANTASTSTSATVSGLAPGSYYFRVSGISPAGVGAFTQSAAVTLPLIPQVVTWTPSNTAITGTSGSIVPSSAASTSGDGSITYAVASAGTSGCTVDSATGVVTYSAPGTCQITASASATSAFSGGSTTVTFTITAPAASSPPARGGGSGSRAPVADAPSGGGALQTITEVRPAQGPITGGNTVAIIGYGFSGATSVTIGGRAAQFTVVNDAHVDVVIPPGSATGSADVAVNLTPERGRAFAPGGYVYTDAPATAPETVVAVPSGDDRQWAIGGDSSDQAPAWVLSNPSEGRQLPRGFTVPSMTDAAGALTRNVRRSLSRNVRKAPRATLPVGEVQVLSVGGVPESTPVRAYVRVGKKYFLLGRAESSPQGTVSLPALLATKKGTFRVRLTTADRERFFLTIRVR